MKKIAITAAIVVTGMMLSTSPALAEKWACERARATVNANIIQYRFIGDNITLHCNLVASTRNAYIQGLRECPANTINVESIKSDIKMLTPKLQECKRKGVL